MRYAPQTLSLATINRNYAPITTDKAALKFLKKTMKRYGKPKMVVTDRLKSYRAAMKNIGNEPRQQIKRWLNNRAENSHQPFRRRERAMLKFRSFATLQKFVPNHSSIHNHFNHDRQLTLRTTFKENRSNALAEVPNLPPKLRSICNFRDHFALV
ncbi:MAG: hypothetical protein COA84_01400 [Robiginitomaculum sp.]|nr:MAG: hypothetical protein COA84_01400 [Robiginitomaculum sp.]